MLLLQMQFTVSLERASASDSRVSTLCVQLDAVFMHGLKAARKKGVELSLPLTLLHTLCLSFCNIVFLWL